MKTLKLCIALACSGLVLSACADTSSSGSSVSTDSQSVTVNDEQAMMDIRRVLAADCSSLPMDVSSMSIEPMGNDGTFDLYNVEGMTIEVNDFEFGPNIADSASINIHDSWGCEGIIHFRD